jgi:glutamate synthase domain-containing protein 2
VHRADLLLFADTVADRFALMKICCCCFFIYIQIARATAAVLRDNISMPTMCAIRHARRIMNDNNASDVTLVATGGIRTPEDFVKAMSLGADAIAVANSAIQAAGFCAIIIFGGGAKKYVITGKKKTQSRENKKKKKKSQSNKSK